MSKRNKQPVLHLKLLPMKRVFIAKGYDPSPLKEAKRDLCLAKTMNAEVISIHVEADVTYYSSLELSPIIFYNFN